MKLKNIWLLLLMSVFIFQACEDDKDPKLDISKVSITTNEIDISEFEVTSENSGREAFNITWAEESEGLNMEMKTTYVIQFDSVGNNFSHAKTFAQTDEKSYSVGSKEINKFLVTNFNQPYDSTWEYEFRVVLGVIGKDNILAPLPKTALNSQTVKITVMELKREPIYIVGNALNGWDNKPESIGNHLQVLFADNNDSDQKYTYTSFFKAGGESKFITIAGDWGTAYGWENGKLVFGKGGNFIGPEDDGLYTLDIDLVEGNVKFTAYTDEVVDYTSVGLRGTAAIDWTTDLPLSKVAEHVWVATNLELKTGEFKFVGNNGGSWWGINNSELPFGLADGDKNINVEAGTYFVAFNDITKHFVVIPMADLP